MAVIDVCRCPHCFHRLIVEPEGWRCADCGQHYGLRSGVPVLLRDPNLAGSAHEDALCERACYSPWKERLVLKALTDAHVALDFGAGRQAFDDPCIIKLDIVFDPSLDLVGDLHELPLESDSIDFAFGGAVMEHVRDPARAISELYRVLRPGGYVYADWSFLAAYHGYPDHYTNVTIHGIQQAFSSFSCLEAGVGPHLGPSWALRSILGTYLEYFKPVSRLDHELHHLLHRVLWHPLDDQDARIAPEHRHRVSAGVSSSASRESPAASACRRFVPGSRFAQAATRFIGRRQ